MTPEMMRRAGVQPTSTDPARTRGQLLRHGSFDVKLGVEASGVLRDGDRIVGVRARETATGREFDVVARYTVGDDGAHSRVREACGIPLALRPFPVDFHCFGIDAWPAALPPAVARVWVNDLRRASRIGGLFVVPFPDGRGAGLVPLRPSALEDLDALHADWRAFSADDPAIAQVTAGRQLPEDFVRVTRQWGHAPRYGCNGAFLLGDAIHPVSPAGGQGANMSVADASALADILLSNHPDPLRAYERRRRPANERSMRFTRLAAAALSAPAIALRIVAPLLLRALARSPQLLPRVLRTASTAFLDSPATR
jgi:2-polyprenyl-6-methoxyphenol hydroxylase-like FAD-dependent oxidoreductase